jgi:hypothetical protein
MRVLYLAWVLASVSCTPPSSQRPSSVPDSGGQTVLVGVPRVVGSAPMNTQLVLQQDGGRTTEISGPLAAELRQLDGARVQVTGRPTGRTLHASGYQVVSVDGRPVETGTVERAPDGGVQIRRADGRIVRLTGATSQLRIGQKVWVQGPTTAAVQVQTYGVITP